MSTSSTEAVESEGNTLSVTRTLDSFVKCSGKKVTTVVKNKIRERTATLVAAAHLPLRFVENTKLDKFAQTFVEIGALYGNVPASDLIVSYNRIIFDPLVWWGEQRYSFPILSHVARTILVISASSAESERHFSGAGRIACKDRNRLKDDAVESSVIYYEGIRKGVV